MHFLAALALQIAVTYGYKKIRESQEDPAEIGDDFKAPTVSEGRKEQIVYGTVPVFKPNILWWGDLRDHTITDVSPGFFPIRHFNVGVQLGLCRGTVDAVTNLWVDEKRCFRYKDNWTDTPVYDLDWNVENEEEDVEVMLDKSTQSSALEGSYYAKVTAHLGSLSQARDTYLMTQQSPAPAYRDLCYLVWKGASVNMPPQELGILDFTRPSGGIGTRTSLRKFAAEVQRVTSVNPLALAAPQRDVGSSGESGVNANPMNVAMDLITNSQTLNEGTAEINTANFATQAATLATEGNGISMILEEGRDLTELLEGIERQINGYIFKDPEDGRWICKLARADYSIPALTSIDESNIVKLESFRRTTWQGTTNQVNVKFNTYDTTSDTWRKSTWARAHDVANYEIQGRYVPVDLEFIGLTDPDLAADLAAREIFARNRPLANAEVLCKREVSNLSTGDVIRFNPGGNLSSIVDLPMRVLKVNRGQDGEPVRLFLVEDVFGQQAAVQGTPGDTGWGFPSSTPQAVPLDEGQALEMPYAIADRLGVAANLLNRIWFAAVQQTDESDARVYTREGADPYALDGTTGGGNVFLKMGTLDADLAADTSQPHATPSQDFTVNNLDYPVSISEISRTLGDLGGNLDHLIMINGELMLARDIENVDDTAFDLKRVYRGVLDTARRAHTMGDDVYLWAWGSDHRATDTDHPQAGNTDLQFRPVTIDGELPAGSANTEVVSLANRGRKPYPPTELNIEATRYPTSSVSLDSTTATGAGVDQVGFDASWTRKDYRTFDQVDAALGVTQGGFPSVGSTEYRVLVEEDPQGTPNPLITGAWDNTGAAAQVVTRTDILAANDGVVPSGSPLDLRVDVETRHTFETVVREADQAERWDFDVTSAFIAGFTGGNNTGAELPNVISGIMTATDTGIYTFTIYTNVLATGLIEARINGGGWTTVIAATLLTGTLAGVTAADTIEWRHTETGAAGVNTFLNIDGPTTTNDGYGVVIT